MSAQHTMMVDFTADAEAILISLQLDAKLAQRVFADAEIRGVRPCDVVANALREHYARLEPR